MSEWRECKIQDIALNMVDAPFGSNLKTHDYTDNGAIVIQGKNIQGRKCVWDDVRFVSKEKYVSLSRHHAKLGCLVFPKVGTIGKVGILTKFENVTEYLLSTNSMMLETNPEIAHQDFIYYFFSSSEVSNYIQSISSNSVQPVFNFTSLKNYPLNLPPLPEQKAIAGVLSSLDDKIDLLHRQNKTLEQMAEALFRQWFVEEDDNGTVSQLITIQNGYAFKSEDFNEQGENGVLKIKNISGNIVDINQTDFINLYTANNVQDRFKVISGDILIAMTGAEIGKLGIIPKTSKKLWLNQRVGLLKEKHKGAKYLAYIQLKSEFGQDYIQNVATGSAQPNISGIGIENCNFPLLSENTIKIYSQEIDYFYEKIIFNLGQIQTLEKLRDNLLPKLMSGELRVKYS